MENNRWWVVGVADGHILFERKDIKDTEVLLGATLLHLARHGYRGLNFSLDPNNPVPVDIRLKDYIKTKIIEALLKAHL